MVTIRIALSSAPRASAALGEILANFTRSHAESHPSISPSTSSRPAWRRSSAMSSSVVSSSESKAYRPPRYSRMISETAK